MFTTQDNDVEYRLSAALWRRPYGNPRALHVYDDAQGTCYVYGEAYGPQGVIRAVSLESAWEIMIDESPTIPQEEVHAAYGYYILHDERATVGPFILCHDDYGTPRNARPDWAPLHPVMARYTTGQAARDAALVHAEENEANLIEGYEYQSNFSGTGIVNVGQYAWIEPLDAWNAQIDDAAGILPVFVPW